MMLDDGALGFLDFGIVGRFDKKTRRDIADYIVAFASGDYRALGRVMMSMGAMSQGIDLDAVAKDLAEDLRAHAHAAASATSTTPSVLPDILRASVKHRMRLPREFVLVTKQMLYFDRYAKLLAPKLNMFTDPRLVAELSADLMRARMS